MNIAFFTRQKYLNKLNKLGGLLLVLVIGVFSADAKSISSMCEFEHSISLCPLNVGGIVTNAFFNCRTTEEVERIFPEGSAEEEARGYVLLSGIGHDGVCRRLMIKEEECDLEIGAGSHMQCKAKRSVVPILE